MANKLSRTTARLQGKSAVCLLTSSGVSCRAHRFHGKETVELLDRLARKRGLKGPNSDNVGSIGGVPMLYTWDSSDCSFVYVYDPELKQQIRLCNVNPEFSRGLSWEMARKIASFARKHGLPFGSDREKRDARFAFGQSIAGNYEIGREMQHRRPFRRFSVVDTE